MKRTLLLVAAVCALLASGIYAFGDIARPKPSPAEGKVIFYSGLSVVSDPKSYEARLQISQETLKRLQDAAAREGGSSSLSQSIMHSSTRTMMAGLFMFLAIWLLPAFPPQGFGAKVLALGLPSAIGSIALLLSLLTLGVLSPSLLYKLPPYFGQWPSRLLDLAGSPKDPL